MGYGPVARAVDWWCAGRDARLDLDVLAGGPPHLLLVQHVAQRRVEREWLRYKADVARHLPALIDARARRDEARTALALAQAQTREPTEEQLTRRLGGEERTAIGVVRDRRLAEHARRLRDLGSRTQRLRAELTRAEQDLVRVSEAVQHRFELAQAKAATLLGYAAHRRLGYLSRLVRRHPAGARASQSVTALVSPQWTVAGRAPDLTQLGGDGDAMVAAASARAADGAAL